MSQRVPPILVSANTIAALSGKATNNTINNRILNKIQNNFGHCRYDPMIMMLAILSFDFKKLFKNKIENL